MAAKDYVYGVKGPARVANQYKWTALKAKIKKIIKEELGKSLEEQKMSIAGIDQAVARRKAEKERQAGGKPEPSWMKDLDAVQKGRKDKEAAEKAKASAAGKSKRRRTPKSSDTAMMQAKVNLAIAGAKKAGKEVPEPLAIDGRTGPKTRAAIKALRALEPTRATISQIISKYAKAVIGDADITKAAAKLAVDAELKTNPSIAALDSALKGMLPAESGVASGPGPAKEGVNRALTAIKEAAQLSLKTGKVVPIRVDPVSEGVGDVMKKIGSAAKVGAAAVTDVGDFVSSVRKFLEDHRDLIDPLMDALKDIKDGEDGEGAPESDIPPPPAGPAGIPA